MICLGGFSFVIDEEKLSPAERIFLSTLHSSPGTLASFEIELDGCVGGSFFGDDFMAAEVEWKAPLIELTHPQFTGTIDPMQRHGVLRRAVGDAFPLLTYLRCCVAALTAATGGIPLHAAGLVHDRSALLFFGRSGAGKSTISERSGLIPLSDELVIVDGQRRARSSGIWGSYPAEKRSNVTESLPIRALVSLEQSEKVAITRLSADEATRRLLAVTLTPPVPSLWSHSIGMLAALVREVPVYSLEWSLADEPITPLLDRLTREDQ